MLKRRQLAIGQAFVWCGFLSLSTSILSVPCRCEDAWYAVPIAELQITEGEVGKRPDSRALDGEFLETMRPRFILDGPGTIWAGSNVGMTGRRPIPNRNQWDGHQPSTIVARAPAGQDITGRMLLPNEDWSGMYDVRFRIPQKLADDEHRDQFLRTQHLWYSQYVQYQIAGAAWFRHRALETELQRGLRPDKALPQNKRSRTYGVFFGTWGVGNSLALEELLNRPRTEAAKIDPHSIPGIEVRKMDWDKFEGDGEAIPDPLSQLIPADQYAIFFSAFRNYLDLIEEIEGSGAPFLKSISPAIEDDRTLSLYQTQLCLPLGDASKAVAGQLIDSLAITGSDPNLRSGTELAVLLETQQPDALRATVSAQQQAAMLTVGNCERRTGEIAGATWDAVVSPGRKVSSYVLQTDRAVIVANSLSQLQRFSKLRAGDERSMASLPEYTQFRRRYRHHNDRETAFVIVPSAAINRWCSAPNRIAATRRTYAAAALADETASQMDNLVAGINSPQPLRSRYFVPEMGPLKLTQRGIADPTYGSLDFLTPISELRSALASESEVAAYEEWKVGHQKVINQSPSSLGAQVLTSPDRVTMDLTVVPSMSMFPYGFLMAFANQSQFKPDSGHRHKESILHLASASGWWLDYIMGKGFYKLYGKSMDGPVSMYFDADPFWQELTGKTYFWDQMMDNWPRTPVAISVDVTDADALRRELTIQETKNDIQLEPHIHRGHKWYRRTIDNAAKKDYGITMTYFPNLVILPDSVHVSPNPKMITAAIDRYVDRKNLLDVDERNEEPEPLWIGKNVALQIRPPAEFLHGVGRHQLEQRLRGQCWSNLRILNEWKTRYPTQDAVALHERIWKSRLSCSAGGTYVWNQAYQTYESTVFGHPAQQKTPEKLQPVELYQSIKRGNFGMTIEKSGLRVRIEIDR